MVKRSVALICFVSMSFPSKIRPFMASAFVRAPFFSRTSKFVPPTLRNPAIAVLNSSQSNDDFSTSSWMDKNSDFKRYDNADDFGGKKHERKSTDKQRRRRNDKRKEDFNEKQHFRDNFQGTRVFVQGIPDSASWQDLKDHFKVAGDVVFASVSIDPSTGMSKGCGVVQYENTDMANKAIKIMRDYPMNGATLFVREDYQEERGGGNRQLGERKRGPTPPSIWRCADETNLALLSDEDTLIVRNLIKARDQARRRKNFDVSDNIREDLKIKYSVHLDDRMKLWWVSSDNAVPQSVSNMKGDGRWGNLKEWRQIPTTLENDACVDPDLVFGLLKQRDIARREKDFSTADRLLEEARTAPDGDLFLRIHDESRTWRIWTEEAPPKPVFHDGPKLSPGEQCIAIVEKHEPAKVGEVKNLLTRFPGREYSILKKLKQNYNV